MLRSMTGFGSAIGKVEGIEYAVEIRSVNHRYFKASVKLPESWAGADVEIEQKLRHALQRGAITCTVRMKIPDDKAACRVNAAALNSYIEQLRYLEVEANPTMRIDLAALLQLPGVCEPPGLEEIIASTHDDLMHLADKALEHCWPCDRAEGAALRQDLLANCQVIRDNLKTVSARAPHVVQEYHVKLASRVAELTRAARIQLDQEPARSARWPSSPSAATSPRRSRDSPATWTSSAPPLTAPSPPGESSTSSPRKCSARPTPSARNPPTPKSPATVVEIKTAIDRIKEQAANAE